MQGLDEQGQALDRTRNVLEREGRALYLRANISDENVTLLAGYERSTVCLCGDLEEQQKEIKEHQGMIPMLQNRFDALASESAVSRGPYDTVLNRMH